MALDYDKNQPIIEVYRCVQTEGSLAGKPHIIVRTTGCTHRCYFGEGGWFIILKMVNHHLHQQMIILILLVLIQNILSKNFQDKA